MNDQHPYAGSVGYDSHPTGSFDNDPLFGSLPGGGCDAGYDTGTYSTTTYDTGQTAAYRRAYDSGTQQYDTGTQWDTGAHATAPYDAYAGYDTGSHPQYGTAQQYDATAWTPVADIPAQGGAPDVSGQWDTSAWYGNEPWATADTAAYDTGTYDATTWNTGPAHDSEPQATHTHAMPVTHADDAALMSHRPHEFVGDQAPFDGHESFDGQASYAPYEHGTDPGSGTGLGADRDLDLAPTGDLGVIGLETVASAPDLDLEGVGEIPAGAHRPVSRRTASRSGGGSRSRRRSPAKRSAFLTVAVPSACVMSVAGIAAASVGGIGGEETKDDSTTTMAAADPGTVEPVAANNKMDAQLANLSADAENFADRASRTQERIDLRERQAADKKKREEEAARKEALRPKYVVPVAQHGLSAYFGQAGVNWMSVHTGIDFPVSYGTPVMAATDGTVRTQWNSAYGNMAIVTMADGTETWYCHLSSTKLRSGPVKAGDVIAYSGNSGNSTGPHMHFEVRPGGGAAIDPLPWLRSHGVDPT